MENLDKGLTVPKSVLRNWTKSPNATKLSAQSKKFAILMKKGFIWRP